MSLSCSGQTLPQLPVFLCQALSEGQGEEGEEGEAGREAGRRLLIGAHVSLRERIFKQTCCIRQTHHHRVKEEAAATDYTHSSHHLILVPQHVTNKSSDQTQVQNQRLSVYDRIKQTEKFLGIKFRQVVSHCVRILLMQTECFSLLQLHMQNTSLFH